MPKKKLTANSKQQTAKKEAVSGMQKAASNKTIQGRVVSAKIPKTVTVLVEGRKIHPLYGKAYKYSKRYLVHDELGVSEGDVIEICQCRPISKNKRFQVRKVIGKDIEAIVTEQLKEEVQEAIAEVMPVEEEREKGQELSIKGEEEEDKNKEVKEEKTKKEITKKVTKKKEDK